MIAFIELSRERYDELLRKEMVLDVTKVLHKKVSKYEFHDVFSHLLAVDEPQENEENVNG